MSERNTLRLFKGPNEQQFRLAVETVVTSHGGHLWWHERPLERDEYFSASHNGNIHAVALPYLSGGADFVFCAKIAQALLVPWIEVRIQEGCLWDYSLYMGIQHLDNFSTLPEYWGEDEDWNATQRGNPRLLSETWGIRQDRIELYLRNWGCQIVEDGLFDTVLRGKAYADDEFEYGDIWQMLDFVRALGATIPYQGEFQHRLQCPSRASLESTDREQV